MTQTAPSQAYRQMAIESSAGDDKLLLLSMHGTEALGRLFQYEVDAFSNGGDPLKAKDILGTNMSVRLSCGKDSTRYFNGYVSRFVLTSVDRQKDGDLRYFYRITLVPWLWFLTRSAGCRIFQDQTVPDIIKSIFKDRGFTDIEDQLTETYRTWEYCVQYRETDFNFVSRLMENEGFYYYFKHENGKHTLVLADAPGCHQKVSGFETISYRFVEKTSDASPFVWNWVQANELLTGGYALNDYNPLTPGTDLYSSISAQHLDSTGKFQLYDYPGAYTTSDEGRSYLRARMGEVESQYSIAHTATNSRGLFAGASFTLQDHPVVANVDYLVTSASYQLYNDQFGAIGRSPNGAAFAANITVQPLNVSYYPPRITPKPTVQGPQTALVVGKDGEEIWTDKYGRIKVKFFWDPDPAANETSSCWVRVAQNWAGKNWGILFMPRIGQEVIVDFLEGDPDRPIVTGRVYNADNMPPYTLPDNKTMSTIKSNSSKGGQGFNEIRFEDKKGDEDLFIHAEKQMDIRVKADRYESIGATRHLVVEKDKFEHVKSKRHEIVDIDHLEQIKQDRHLTINGNDNKQVDKALSLKVSGAVAEEFGDSHSESVTNDYYLKADNIVIEGKTKVTIKVGSNYLVLDSSGVKLASETGTLDTLSGSTTTIKSNMDMTVQANMALNLKSNMDLTAEGTIQATLKGMTAQMNGSAMSQIQGGMIMIG